MKKIILLIILINFISFSQGYKYDEQNPLNIDTIKFNLPFYKGNKFQYIYETWGNKDKGRTLNTVIFDKDTVIEGNRYIYQFETLLGKHLTRYDPDSNKAYIYSSVGDRQLIDFGTSHAQYYDFFNVYNNSWQRKQMIKYYELILGDSLLTMKLEGSTLGAVYEYFLYAKDLGLVYDNRTFYGPNGTGGGWSNKLISAVIYDTLGNYKYYVDSTKCTIENYLVNIYNKDTVHISAKVTHEYENGFGFISNVYAEYFYKKGDIASDTFEIKLNTYWVGKVYRGKVQLDKDFIEKGYELYYRIRAKDIHLIPIYYYTEYFKADNTPILNTTDEQVIKYIYLLEQNYPNPFNPITTIKYAIERPSNVVIKIFDVLGNEVTKLVDEPKERGYYSVDFDASKLASGIYYYSISAGEFYSVKKMVLLK